jgi:hypothetical protein
LKSDGRQQETPVSLCSLGRGHYSYWST